MAISIDRMFGMSERMIVSRVAKHLKVDPVRFIRADKNFNVFSGQDEMYFEFSGVHATNEMEKAIAELAALITDELRGTVLKASSPETYEKIRCVIKTFETDTKHQAIRLTTHQLQELLRVSDNPSRSNPSLDQQGWEDNRDDGLNVPPLYPRRSKNPPSGF